ncbi:MAG: hypothetical protein OXL37_05750 [Chloroflexota bacterium]|nr:hypothetical protein [Chloroflexota bacterium]MDE2962047.1 hypothetical protein [Chloroflexota bacterium]
METVTLDRFELVGPLGSGADYDVRAAVDRETGEPVVLKRPTPQTVSRQMHGPTEERTARALEAYERAGQYCQVVPRVIGATEVALHDEYFGEDLGQPYSVRVEERAGGIPLVGDPRSRILRVPIGLGQNLFALHPLALPAGVHDWPIQEQLLEAQEIYANAGYALLDLGPHNVFYSPGTGRISLVDASALVGHGVERSQGNRGPQDVHDFYIEMVKFYLAPELPPLDAAGHFDPYNQRPVISIEDECDSLSGAFASADDALRDVTAACLGKIRQRGYESVAEFASDLRECLRLITIRNDQMADREAAREAWRAALHRLSEDHWTRYRFDANTELAALAG